MWQPVPWFVAGGLHSPEVARLLAYAATGGKEGVIEAGDCKVKALDIPATAVRVVPGGLAIRNRAAGAGGQSYFARNPEDEEVALTATGSGGPRTDLIIARIEDPQYSPWETPADPEAGPYVFSRVIEGVPADTSRVQQLAGHENDSADTLARVTRPASTGTVQAAHITDLRQLVQPRSHRILRAYQPVADNALNAVSPASESWPLSGGWSLAIPEWANRVVVVAQLAGISVAEPGVTGVIRIRLGDEGDADQMLSESTYYNMSNGGTDAQRIALVTGDELDVPSAYRGTFQRAVIRANISAAVPSVKRPTADTGSTVLLDLQFMEVPE